MSVSFFDSKALMPNDEMVAVALAETFPLWEEIQNHVQENYPNVSSEWKYYGKSSGWVGKLYSKKRNLLFFIPLNGCFRLRFCFGEKAVACIEVSDLPEDVKEMIRTATPYAEGCGIDIDINSHEQLDTIKTLLKIKFEN